MNVPEELSEEKLEHAELLINLPPGLETVGGRLARGKMVLAY